MDRDGRDCGVGVRAAGAVLALAHGAGRMGRLACAVLLLLACGCGSWSAWRLGEAASRPEQPVLLTPPPVDDRVYCSMPGVKRHPTFGYTCDCWQVIHGAKTDQVWVACEP